MRRYPNILMYELLIEPGSYIDIQNHNFKNALADTDSSGGATIESAGGVGVGGRSRESGGTHQVRSYLVCSMDLDTFLQVEPWGADDEVAGVQKFRKHSQLISFLFHQIYHKLFLLKI